MRPLFVIFALCGCNLPIADRPRPHATHVAPDTMRALAAYVCEDGGRVLKSGEIVDLIYDPERRALFISTASRPDVARTPRRVGRFVVVTRDGGVSL